MAIRQIRYEGDDILRKKCKRVEEVNDHIRMLLDDMLDTLHNTKDGAAIAAPQVGIVQRLVVIDMGNGVIKLINPEIIVAPINTHTKKSLNCAKKIKTGDFFLLCLSSFNP